MNPSNLEHILALNGVTVKSDALSGVRLPMLETNPKTGEPHRAVRMTVR